MSARSVAGWETGKSVDRAVCIVNPAAGGGVDVPELESLLGRLADFEVTVQRTSGAGDAERLARRAARSGVGLLLVAGGDGTLHEVVNGLAERGWPVPVAVLPFGTGNDFARSVGAHVDVEAILSALEGFERRAVDLVRVETRLGDERRRGRWIVNACTGGFSGQVAEDASERDKERWGPLAYLRTAASALLGEREAYDVEVRYEPAAEAKGGSTNREATRASVLNVALANGGWAGGGVPIAPGAEIDDGALDLVLIRDATLAELTLHLPQLAGDARPGAAVRGSAADASEPSPGPGDSPVYRRRVRRVVVRARAPMPWSLDGESVTADVVGCTVRPGALTVLARAAGADADRGAARAG